MRRSWSTVLLIMLLAILSVSAAGKSLDVRLYKIDIKGDEWSVFRRADDKVSGPQYRIYGDTLLCEVFNDVRLWYGLQGDTVLYLGEECRYSEFMLASPVPTSSFSLDSGQSGEESVNSRGFVYTTLPSEREYVHTGSVPVRGRIVMEDGRSVPATAVTETFSYVQSYVLNPEKPVLSRNVYREITRWFLPGESVPAVFQITEKTDNGDGSDADEFTETYSVDLGTVCQDENDGLTNEWLTDAVNVSVSGNRLVITGEIPVNAVMEVNISTVSGTLCHTYPSVSSGSDRTVELVLPSLPVGNYIVTVSAGSPVSKKQLIKI